MLQPQDYHSFADSRGIGVIPNAIDVLSNLAFLIAGAVGLRLASRAPFPQQASLHLFAMGLVLTALGSAYYHWAPTDKTLLWDRLPMALAFAGAVGAMASQYLREACFSNASRGVAREKATLIRVAKIVKGNAAAHSL